MYRILKCDRDTYITDKIINGSRSLDANVGQASSLDLYKLYNETYMSGSTNPIEKTRLLLHFDLGPLRELTGSLVNYATSSFKCFLSLKDIYGGQSVPSNFTVAIHPLAKTFSEGRGRDVISYRDIDAANWLSSSITGSSSTATLWEISGANKVGLLGSNDIDYYGSGNLGFGVVPVSTSFSFERGDEDMFVDVTTIVSATLAGQIPDYGFRIALTASFENDTNTYFVKRFSSRHVRNSFNHPKLHVYYNDSYFDSTSEAYLNINNTIFTYNSYLGSYRNFVSGATTVTGSNSVILELVASRSLTTWTSSFSQTHSASINHLTRSWYYFSSSITGSQHSVNGNFVSGAYFANVFLDTTSTYLSNYMNAADWQGNGKITDLAVSTIWKSANGTSFFFSSGSGLTFKGIHTEGSFVFDDPYTVSVPNLKNEYYKTERTRLRVLVFSNYSDMRTHKFNTDSQSKIFQNMFWRLKHAYTKREIIPFETTYNSTKLSSDNKGMFFDFWMTDLEINQVYELEFLIREDGKDKFITNQGFVFKVVD